ncbi:MAG: Tol-Pal system protein TolB [Gammaproteobacteria bacterium]|nr:Tol-Pal system protein TolB [Gammaproteobacteria bacterium]
MKRIVFLILAVCLSITQSLKAEIEIVITEGRDDARPIAIVPFAFESSSVVVAPPFDFAKIIADDLARSGKFNPTEIGKLPQRPASIEQVDLSLWKQLGVDAVVYGVVKEKSPGTYQVSYDLVDPYNDKAIFESEIAEGSYPLIEQSQHLLLLKDKILSNDNFRWNAHIAADEIYEALTGERGAFATQIAYVEVDRSQPNPYQLFVSDSDGYGAQRIFSSRRPIMSPAWSPDGQQLAYVSFENGRSEIIVQDLARAQRSTIASYKGFNSAPAFSPDGSKMAMVLSKDGNPEIYIMDLVTRDLQRLTRHYAIDTEPSWSPDGKSLVFTSDRGGRPQIYQVFLGSGETKRVTFEGRYNAGAEFSPDGNSIVMVHQNNGNFHLASQELDTGAISILTKTRLDESLSIAPNGSMIIYSTVDGRQKVLSTISMDGRFGMPIPSTTGEVKAPAWSPFLR